MEDTGINNSELLQRLLRLTSHGAAVITELYRLIDALAPCLQSDTNSRDKYTQILFDFTYFNQSESLERRVNNNEELLLLDGEWYQRYSVLLARWYRAMVAVYRFGGDINAVVTDIDQSVYLQQSLDSVFSSSDGRQLLCELLYLYGVMLLTVDTIDGKWRERLIVAHYRHTMAHGAGTAAKLARDGGVSATSARAAATSIGSTTFAVSDTGSCHVDDVCRLMRCTSRSRDSQTSPNYPQAYFQRLEIDQRLVKMVVTHLVSGDIYYQTSNYRLPEHRSVALAMQASLLFVCLFFCADKLQNDNIMMREIVDRFFGDTWVVNIHMGWCVSLFEWWRHFRAARTALHARLTLAAVRQLAQHHGTLIERLVDECGTWLQRLATSDMSLLQQLDNLMTLVRQCNVTLRWVMMNSVASSGTGHVIEVRHSRQLRELLLADTRLAASHQFQLLFRSAQLELHLKQLLSDRQTMWTSGQRQLVEELRETAHVFSADYPLNKLTKNAGLESWFRARADDMAALTLPEVTGDSRRLLQMIHALGKIQSMHRLEADPAVTHRLTQLCVSLRHLVAVAALRDTFLASLDCVTDFGYGCRLIRSLADHIQCAIQQQPTILANFHAIFVKLSSALESPLIRVSQADSADLPSVSHYYSSILIDLVKQLLHVVPQDIFRLIEKLAEIERDNSDSDNSDSVNCVSGDQHCVGLSASTLSGSKHNQLSSIVGELCCLVDGVLCMQSSLVGVVRVDPRQLLEEGLRQQLAAQLSGVLQRVLVTSAGSSWTSISHRNKSLADCLADIDGCIGPLRAALEFVQEYLRVSGRLVWQEELTRLVNRAVDQTQQWLLVHYRPCGAVSSLSACPGNIMAAITDLLLAATNPRQSVYIEQLAAWHSCSSTPPAAAAAAGGGNLHVLCSWHTIRQLAAVLSPSTVAGCSQLLHTLTICRLQAVVDVVFDTFFNDSSASHLLDTVKSAFASRCQESNLHKLATASASRLRNSLAKLLDHLAALGQLVLLRDVIALPLQIGSDLANHGLSSSLATLNRALISDTKLQLDDQASLQKKPCPVIGRQQCDVMSQRQLCDTIGRFSPFLSAVGLSDAGNSIYLTDAAVKKVMSRDLLCPLLLLLFVHCHLSKLAFSTKLGYLSPLRDGTDMSAILSGISCFLLQLPTGCYQQLLVAMATFGTACVPRPSHSTTSPSRSSLSSSVTISAVTSADLTAWFVLMQRLLHQSPLADKLTNYVPLAVVNIFKV